MATTIKVTITITVSMVVAAPMMTIIIIFINEMILA